MVLNISRLYDQFAVLTQSPLLQWNFEIKRNQLNYLDYIVGKLGFMSYGN